MNEAFNEVEEAIRERLVHSSVDVHEVDALRSRVLAALEKGDAVLPTQTPSFWARKKRTAGLALGVAAAIAAAVVFLPEQPNQTVVLSADEPSSTATAEAAVDSGAPRLGLSDISDSLALSPPQEGLGNWVLRTEDEQILTMEFVPDGAQPGDSRQYLRIVAPPPATTAVDVVDSLTSSLFDTIVVRDAASRIGDLESRALRLETVGGTTHLGFRVAADTYLETEGTDRVFIVHVTTARPETLVLWIEAGTGHIDEFEKIASRLIATLDGG